LNSLLIVTPIKLNDARGKLSTVEQVQGSDEFTSTINTHERIYTMYFRVRDDSGTERVHRDVRVSPAHGVRLSFA
jgi:hypothetical protein